MKHIHPINPGSGDEAGVKPMSFDCLLGITDICTVYDKAMVVVHTITATMTWMAAASAL